MPEVNRKSLEKGDKIRYKDGSHSCDWNGVKIEDFSKDRKRIAVEKGIYNGCHGQMTGTECYSIDASSVTEVQRWVKVVDSEETQDEIIERQRKRIEELEEKIENLEGDIEKVQDVAFRGR